MTAGWPAPVAWALSRGPVVAALVSLALSPGVHALIAAVLERRRLRPRYEFVAVTVGDPLLALAVGVGVVLSPQGVNAAVRPAVANVSVAAVLVFWVVFGLWQWRTEFRHGYYSGDQIFAPTKIWHQLGVYPLLGSVTYSAVVSGMAAPLGHAVAARLLGKAAIAIAILGWAAANAYDRGHPKLGHPPYSWRRLRTPAKPWPVDSTTLRWYQGARSVRCGQRLGRFHG